VGPRRLKKYCSLSLSLCLVALLTPIVAYTGITKLDLIDYAAGAAEPGARVPERQRPAGDREPTPGTKTTSAGQADRSVIKCWQKGTLLLEEKGWKLVAPEGQRVAHAEFQRPGNGDTHMYWINLGETFCFMKSK
jgi:hypothetical protein